LAAVPFEADWNAEAAESVRTLRGPNENVVIGTFFWLPFRRLDCTLPRFRESRSLLLDAVAYMDQFWRFR